MDVRQSGDPLNDPAKEPAALRSLLGRTNRDWWPNQLSLEILHQHGLSGNPMGDAFLPGRYAVHVAFTGFDQGSVAAMLPIEIIP